MFKSLKGRLVLVASFILIVFIGLAGVALDSAYRLSLEEAKQQELNLQSLSLLAIADETETQLTFPQALPDGRFSNGVSGLYAYVSETDAGTFWRSDSAIGLNLPKPNSYQVDSSSFSRVKLDNGETAFLYQHVYSYPTLDDEVRSFAFSILEHTKGFEEQAVGFRNTLWLWLAVLALILIIIQWVVMLWGLSPLNAMADELHAIESGQADGLSRDYPKELQGVTQNLNLLVDNERRQRERYRNTMADLAHSLKTPLAILNGMDVETSEREQTQHLVREQVDRMNQIIGYQLQRAVSATPNSILKGISLVAPVNKILTALEKVYRDRSVKVVTLIDEKAFFHGDQGDLMEMMGNLLDNAFKYGDDQIQITAKPVINDSEKRPGLEVLIEDNGPGVPDAKKQTLFKRGERADTQQSGQGIGLAVVSDIVSSYGGDIRIEDSPLGGSCFKVLLP